MGKGKYGEWITNEGLVLVEGWARDGLTYEQIARNMGITGTTLDVWRKRFPAISGALKKGREVADYEVENALYKKAVGARYTEVIEECNEDGDLVVSRRITKEVPPDTTAAIFWLKNRQPKKWRTNPEPDGEEALRALDAVLAQIKSAF